MDLSSLLLSFLSFRSEIRRLKLCLLLLNKEKKVNRLPCQFQMLTCLDARSASLLRQTMADCKQSSTSAVLSCLPRHMVS